MRQSKNEFHMIEKGATPSATSGELVSLAVMPLELPVQNTRLDMFCRGLVMDLTADLARFHSLQVISYDTSRFMAGDAEAVNSYNINYLLKGLVQTADQHLVLHLQLVNAHSGLTVWGEKFEGDIDDFLAFQTKIIEGTVLSLQQTLDQHLVSVVRQRPPASLGVYALWLRGYNELQKGALEADEKARAYFQQAIDLDPHYARAYTGMSLSYFNEWSCQLWTRWDVSRSGALEWALQALELDDTDHISNAIMGRIFVYEAEYEKAEHYLRRSLRMNPNDAETLIVIVNCFGFLGYIAEARELYARLCRLNPIRSYAIAGAFIAFEAGDFDEAIATGEKVLVGQGWVDFPAFLGAAWYHKGNLEMARKQWTVYLKEFERTINEGKPADSSTALQWMINVNPYRGDSPIKAFWDYLAAGPVDQDQPPPVAEPVPVESNDCCFIYGQGGWTLAYNGQEMQIRDLKGLHDIAHLLAHPGQDVHCTELMKAKVLQTDTELIDSEALQSYRNRIRTLQEEIEEATDMGNIKTAAARHEELDALIEHLSAVTGLGGRHRKKGGTVEKCRTAVTWRIRNAIKRVAEIHPELGKHLQVSIRTGVFCTYTPEHSLSWKL